MDPKAQHVEADQFRHKIVSKKFFEHSRKNKRWLFSIKARRSAKQPASFRLPLVNTSCEKEFKTADEAQQSLLAVWAEIFQGKQKRNR